MSPSGAVPAAAGLCIARCPPCPPRTTGARTAARSAPLRESLPHTAAAAGWGRRGHTLSHLGARGGAPLPPPPPKRLERPLFLSPGACSVDALYGTQDRQRGAPRRHGWLARRALPRGGCGRRGRTKPLLGGTTGGCASRNGRHGRLRVSWCRPLWRGAGPLVPPLPFPSRQRGWPPDHSPSRSGRWRRAAARAQRRGTPGGWRPWSAVCTDGGERGAVLGEFICPAHGRRRPRRKRVWVGWPACWARKAVTGARALRAASYWLPSHGNGAVGPQEGRDRQGAHTDRRRSPPRECGWKPSAGARADRGPVGR